VYISVTEFSVKNFRDVLYSVVFMFFINLWFMVSYENWINILPTRDYMHQRKVI
jgi:hypothetical protein